MDANLGDEDLPALEVLAGGTTATGATLVKLDAQGTTLPFLQAWGQCKGRRSGVVVAAAAPLARRPMSVSPLSCQP